MFKQNPLKQLREESGFTQIEIANKTGLTPTRISLSEHDLVILSVQESEKVCAAIAELTKERAGQVLREADPRLRAAIEIIESRPSAKKAFATAKESFGYSDEAAAVFVLGRNYPKGVKG